MGRRLLNAGIAEMMREEREEERKQQANQTKAAALTQMTSASKTTAALVTPAKKVPSITKNTAKKRLPYLLRKK